MTKLRILSIILISAAQAACAFNPVLTPYAVGNASQAPESQVATVWGAADNTRAYFRKIDGHPLPSRSGGGYPISIRLLPGRYISEIYFQILDDRGKFLKSGEISFPIIVEAGRTYVLQHKIHSNNNSASINLIDIGESKCEYEATSNGLLRTERLKCNN